MQIYRIREGKFLEPFLLENIYEYVFDENPCLLLSRNKVFTYHEISEIMYRVYAGSCSFNKDYTKKEKVCLVCFVYLCCPHKSPKVSAEANYGEDVGGQPMLRSVPMVMGKYKLLYNQY